MKRKRAIVRIKEYISTRKGYFPSLNEIARHTGLNWETVKDNVEVLKQLEEIKPVLDKILVHHGTCDYCLKRSLKVVHYNYDKQPRKDFRLCKKCIELGVGQINKNL